MNREERRRAAKNQRRSQAGERQIRPERWDAELQDFTAGTNFVAGAVGIRPDKGDTYLPPVFIVLLDDSAFRYEPQLINLFAELEANGTLELHNKLAGTVRWGSFPAPNGMLARLEVNLTAPVKASPSFLLLADNYAEIWDIPASHYLLGLTTKKMFDRLGPTASYTDLLNICVTFNGTASKAAQGLVRHYKGEASPADESPVPPLLILNDSDDMRFQLGMKKSPDGTNELAFMLLRPSGVVSVPLGTSSVPTIVAQSYAARGLHWFEEGTPYRLAEGWTWEETSTEFIINDAAGTLVASFEPSGVPGEDGWLRQVRTSGLLALHVGDELVPDGDTMSTGGQLAAAHDRGNVVSGLVLSKGAREQPPSSPRGVFESVRRTLFGS